jgi:hypothetical protein
LRVGRKSFWHQARENGRFNLNQVGEEGEQFFLIVVEFVLAVSTPIAALGLPGRAVLEASYLPSFHRYYLRIE